MSSFPDRSRASFDLSNTLYIAALICMCLAESFMIRGVLLRSALSLHRRVDLPLLAWIPALGGFLLLQNVRRQMKEGRLNPVFARNLSSGLALLLLLVYLLITRFAQIAFR